VIFCQSTFGFDLHVSALCSGNPGPDPGEFKCRHFCFASFEELNNLIEASPGASICS
jgi:hypothetical protein